MGANGGWFYRIHEDRTYDEAIGPLPSIRRFNPVEWTDPTFREVTLLMGLDDDDEESS